MTSTLAAFALRVADFYLLATVFLLGTAAVMVVLRQPVRRLTAASAGLVLLAVLPFWPHVPVGRLCAAVYFFSETAAGVAGPVAPPPDPAGESGERLLDERPLEREAAELSENPAMPPEDASRLDFGIALSDRVLAWRAGLFLAGAGGTGHLAVAWGGSSRSADGPIVACSAVVPGGTGPTRGTGVTRRP
jgi:hypothetical protein